MEPGDTVVEESERHKKLIKIENSGGNKEPAQETITYSEDELAIVYRHTNSQYTDEYYHPKPLIDLHGSNDDTDIQAFLNNLWNDSGQNMDTSLGEILDPASWNTPRTSLETWWFMRGQHGPRDI